jgi:hypothetical protein
MQLVGKGIITISLHWAALRELWQTCKTDRHTAPRSTLCISIPSLDCWFPNATLCVHGNKIWINGTEIKPYLIEAIYSFFKVSFLFSLCGATYMSSIKLLIAAYRFCVMWRVCSIYLLSAASIAASKNMREVHHELWPLGALVWQDWISNRFFLSEHTQGFFLRARSS